MVKHKIVLLFPATVVEQPFLYNLVKDYNLVINVLKANINPRKQGMLVLELAGEKVDYESGIDFLESRGVKIKPLEQQIVWNDDSCTHCGACTVICPTSALEMIRPEMTVKFDGEKCIACGHCLKACPVRAVEEHY